jgi:hypothetical protein
LHCSRIGYLLEQCCFRLIFRHMIHFKWTRYPLTSGCRFAGWRRLHLSVPEFLEVLNNWSHSECAVRSRLRAATGGNSLRPAARNPWRSIPGDYACRSFRVVQPIFLRRPTTRR